MVNTSFQTHNQTHTSESTHNFRVNTQLQSQHTTSESTHIITQLHN